MMKQYEHLGSKRAQKQEVALVETELNLLQIQSEELLQITSDPKTMMGLAIRREEVQTLARAEEVKASLAMLRARLNAIRFRMRPMVMVQELGDDIDAVAEHSFDNAILEVVASPGYLDRLSLLREKQMERLAAFRRNSGWASRLEFCDGDYRRRAAISTVLIASGDELNRGWSDRLLRTTGLLDEVFVCKPGPASEIQVDIPDPGDQWAAVVQRLLASRIAGEITNFKFSPSGRKKFEEVRREFLKRGNRASAESSVVWGENGPALVAKLAMCARLLRSVDGAVVEAEDVEIAISITTKPRLARSST